MAREMKRVSRGDDESDINLTPMLDVVFIMLIFFIVTATFIKQAGIEVFRPEALTAVQKPTVSVLVAISENGDIWIDKQKVDAAAVRAHIERLHSENPKGGLVVQAVGARSAAFDTPRTLRRTKFTPCLCPTKPSLPLP